MAFRGTLTRMAGRKPAVGEARDEYLRVRIAAFESEILDKASGADDLNRSEYVRKLIREDGARKGLT